MRFDSDSMKVTSWGFCIYLRNYRIHHGKYDSHRYSMSMCDVKEIWQIQLRKFTFQTCKVDAARRKSPSGISIIQWSNRKVLVVLLKRNRA